MRGLEGSADGFDVFHRILGLEAALEAADGDGFDAEARLCDKALLHAALVADKQYFRIGTLFLDIARDGKRGIDVTRGAAARKKNLHKTPPSHI